MKFGGKGWVKEWGEPDVDLINIATVSAETQEFLAKESWRDSGILDLVVRMTDRNGRTSTAWVEVKIDAPLTERRLTQDGVATRRDQLDVYLEHSKVLPGTFILALTKSGSSITKKNVTEITWNDIASAAAVFGGGHNAWTDLVDFLRAQGVLVPCASRTVGESTG